MLALNSEHVSKTYRRKDHTRVALQDASIQVRPGEVVGFLGPNGAGKTTFIKCSCGLVWADEGLIEVMGLNVKTHTEKAAASIGAVLEGSRNVFWQLSPRENLIYFGRLRGLPQKVIRERTQVVTRDLALEDFIDRPVKELSRGMQQKIAIAVALLHDPALLLLDEPTLGLDVEATEAMVRVLQNLVRRDGKGVLLATHQLELAERICDRIAVIRKGRLLLFENTGDLLQRFERNRASEIIVTSPIEAALLSHLSGRYPHVTYTEDSRQTVFTVPIHDAPPAEELFTELWRAGCEIGSYSRRTHLREVYDQLVADDDANRGGET